MKLTVYFDGSLWCGLIEYEGENNDYRAFKHIFGPEPKNAEIERFVYMDLNILVDQNDFRWNSNKNIMEIEVQTGKINPKRMQRKINKEKKKKIGISTKAQKAIGESRSQNKIFKKTKNKQDREEEQKIRFEKKMQKKHKKRKGH